MDMRKLFLIAAVFSTTLNACVSIKPSSVQLSVEVGQRIAEMERIHLLSIHRYFDMEIQKIEDFMTSTWEPIFLRNFLGTSGVLKMLQNVSSIDYSRWGILKESISRYLTDTSEAERATSELVRLLGDSRKGDEGTVRATLKNFVEEKYLDAAVIHISSLIGTDEPARIMIEFVDAAHREMLSQRRALLAPIEQARMETIAAISGAYADLIRGQSTITGRLEAAAKVSRQQDAALATLGVDSALTRKVTEQLSDLSSRVNNALNSASKVVNNLDKDNSSQIINTLKAALISSNK
jgi:hypothetical protein